MVTSSSVPSELFGDPPRSPGLCSNFGTNQDLPEDLLSCGSLLVDGRAPPCENRVLDVRAPRLAPRRRRLLPPRVAPSLGIQPRV